METIPQKHNALLHRVVDVGQLVFYDCETSDNLVYCAVVP